MTFEHPSTRSLAAVVQSAGEFGLASHEVWEIVMATPDRLPTDLRARYIDELSGELARRLLEKQRASQDALRTIRRGLIPRRSPLVSSGSPRRHRPKWCRPALSRAARSNDPGVRHVRHIGSVISLDDAPEGYREFDRGVPRKYSLIPHA